MEVDVNERAGTFLLILIFPLSLLLSGRKRNGTVPSHFCPSSASIARRVLQALENLKLVEKDPTG